MRPGPGRRARRHDEGGFALSSPVALLSAAAVVLAGIAFLGTGHDDRPAAVAKPLTVTPTPTAAPTTAAPKPVIKAKKHPKPVVRRTALVEVYNNSGIHGLAGGTSRRASDAGWEVVGSDNWYGTISASTVYYPRRLETQAKLLARDLGIRRLRLAIAPMKFDRLTVILTRDYA